MFKQAATRDAYGKTLVELGKKNKDIVVLDADLSGSTRTGWFAKEYPDRFFNAGIAEQNMIGMAAGMAVGGKIPFVSTFAVFATGRCWEQIRNSIAYPCLNVKIAASHAGITVGEDGATHQALEDISIMRSIPYMTVVVPADAISAEHIIREAAKAYGPWYIRMSRGNTPLIYDSYPLDFKIGKNNLVRRGKDVTVIACGMMVSQALLAAEELEKDGIDVAVMDMHTIKPVDKDSIIGAADHTGAIVTAEEHTVLGGLGSAVAEVLMQHRPVPLEMVGVQGVFGESGAPDELLKKYGLTQKDIVKAVKKVLGRKEKFQRIKV
jgi:transketolase